MKNKTVKVAMFKMKFKDLRKVISVEDINSWIPYPGDFTSEFSDIVNGDAIDAMTGTEYRNKGMVFYSAN